MRSSAPSTTRARPFDVVSYVADGEHRGKFGHRPPDGEPRLIERPNDYAASRSTSGR